MRTLLDRMHSLALQASQRSDVVIACFTMLAIVMIIIPLPTALVDVLIALNIAVSLLILIVTFYIRHPVDFSALPPVILLATLFRLALSITTTRLILLQADAGKIVSAFGHFVIAGQVVIGLVVFFIIAIAQFVVITKGAERVAEVAARFVLDAMPGKQMSIDNDLRNGDIDSLEGKRRRNLLERESQLYGAMDGAMKFVKGDAIAVLIILFINLVGGLAIGMLEHGMPFSQAIRTYSLLTVGDGLIAQIPALLISVGAGTVVTRVSSDNRGDLGGEIISQLGRSDRALMLTALILAGIAFIPGFSTIIFLLLSAGLAFAAWSVRRRNRVADAVDSEAGSTTDSAGGLADQSPTPVAEGVGSNDRVVIRLSRNMANTVVSAAFTARIEARRSALQDRLGIEAPDVGWRVSEQLQPTHARIDLDTVPIARETIVPDAVLAEADRTTLETLDIEIIDDEPLETQVSPRQWVSRSAADALEAASVPFQTAEARLMTSLDRVLDDYADEFLGIQETQNLLKSMQSAYPDLVGQATQILDVARIAETLRQLVDEGVPVNPLRSVLEALVEQGPNQSAAARNSAVRHALSRVICHRYADDRGVLHAWAISPGMEQRLAKIGQRIREGKTAELSSEFSDQLDVSFRRVWRNAREDERPLVICSANMRRPLFDWSRRQGKQVTVLAWSEVASGYKVRSLGLLGGDDIDSSNAEQYEKPGYAARA